MSNDPKCIVVSGYDEVANAYLERFGVSTVRQKWVDRLIDGLPAGGGRVLDLGSGAGIPIARDLAARAHAVVGVDGSAQQVARARRNVPKATFREADMCEVAFEIGSFHAVGAFYSITHIPPTQQGPLIANIAAWLKPGGMFVASFGSGAAGEWTGEWLGTTMFFGHNGEAETLRCLADSGLRVRDPSVEKQDNEEAAFMWIEAVKDRYPPDHHHVHRPDRP
jgi:SAM-dependent methyltransferase